MAIAYVSGSVKALTSSGGTVVITKPSSVVATNTLVALLDYGTVTTLSYTPPTGWASHGSQFIHDVGLFIFTKTATGSEPSTYTFVLSASAIPRAGAILQFSGVTTSTPVDVKAFKGTTTTTYTWTRPTTSHATEMLVLGVGSFTGGTFSTPSGTTAREAANSGFATIASFSALQASAGETAAYTSTGTHSTGNTVILALNPTGAAASNTTRFFHAL